MTITWEDLQKANVPSIRSKVKSSMPQRKELKGAKFDIAQLFDKEIYVIDWLFVEKSPINKDKELLKLQFYFNGILGVVYTTADDIVQSVHSWQNENGGEIKPFKDTIIQSGMSYTFKDIGENTNDRTNGKPNVRPPSSIPEGILQLPISKPN